MKSKVILYLLFFMSISNFTSSLYTGDDIDMRMHARIFHAVIGLIASAYQYSTQLSYASIPEAKDGTITDVIFDLNGVLITTNKLQAFQEIGVWNLIQHVKQYKTLPSGAQFMKTLYELDEYATASSSSSTHEGKIIPLLMHDHIIGTDIDLEKQILQPMQEQGCSQALIAAARIAFSPDHFLRTRKLLREGIRLVKALKAKGYRVHILSNWDKYSFNMIQSYPEIAELYDLFNDDSSITIISGSVHAVKPDAEIFEIILQRLHDQFGVTPEQCIFFDDERANVEQANLSGINAFLYDAYHPEQARDHLLKLLTPRLESSES